MLKKESHWKGLFKEPLEIKSTMAEMKLSPKALKSEFKEISQNTELKVNRWRMWEKKLETQRHNSGGQAFN